ncbi:hypothetical protein SADUNF_Sadunf16G0036200 [Salix dunnii]|uniref:Methyltransferase type 11 domain-containing protein n=1 Tax=Salix dunnii TaxID=1413687 RepID=A0A835MI64_9ROSI|nr:hypothetical protein SADUNF_Sadunf16G0036200 [Salix dunnii]
MKMLTLLVVDLRCGESTPVSTHDNIWLPLVLNISTSLPQPSACISAAPPDNQHVQCTSPPPIVPSTSTVQHNQLDPLSKTQIDSTDTMPDASTTHISSSPPPPPIMSHPMITRSKNNIYKPIQKHSYHIQLSPSAPIEPTSVTQALKDPNWRLPMQEEYTALLKNETWSLVPSTTASNFLSVARIYKKVTGTDTSLKQLEFAPKLPNVSYHHTTPVMSGSELEQIVSAQSSVDVVTIAQAMHWFDLHAFYQQSQTNSCGSKRKEGPRTMKVASSVIAGLEKEPGFPVITNPASHQQLADHSSPDFRNCE